MWLRVKASGISTLVVMTLAALALIALIGLIITISVRGRQARDATRQQHLQIIGLAEEYYFDQWRRYGDGEALRQAGLLTNPPLDPATNEPYQLYRNHLNDEWCAWAKAEDKPSTYFVQHEGGVGVINNQPTNLATCKSSL